MTLPSPAGAMLRQLAETRLRPGARRLLICLSCGALGVVAVMEGFNAPYLLAALAGGLCGILTLAALAAPEGTFASVWTFGRCTALAASASFALSVVEASLPQGPENTPGMVELCALLLLVSRSVRRGPPLRAAALAVMPALAALVLPLRIEDRTQDQITLLFIEALMVVALPSAVVFGLGMRLRDALRARERDAIRQEQRMEHARQLHDFVAHHVTAIVAQTKAARFTAAAGHSLSPQDLDTMLVKIEQAGEQALGSMRTMVTVLRDPVARAATRPPGDLEGLRRLTEEFSALGPTATLRLDPGVLGRVIPLEVTTTVHDVVRESLTNVRKHSEGAQKVEVRVAPSPRDPDWFEVSVSDDGRRREAQQPAAEGGFGLIGLNERVEDLGGHLAAGSGEGEGWRVLAVLPLTPGARTAGPPRPPCPLPAQGPGPPSTDTVRGACDDLRHDDPRTDRR
jgi:signal transduction histidine kinase